MIEQTERGRWGPGDRPEPVATSGRPLSDRAKATRLWGDSGEAPEDVMDDMFGFIERGLRRPEGDG